MGDNKVIVISSEEEDFPPIPPMRKKRKHISDSSEGEDSRPAAKKESNETSNIRMVSESNADKENWVPESASSLPIVVESARQQVRSPFSQATSRPIVVDSARQQVRSPRIPFSQATSLPIVVDSARQQVRSPRSPFSQDSNRQQNSQSIINVDENIPISQLIQFTGGDEVKQENKTPVIVQRPIVQEVQQPTNVIVPDVPDDSVPSTTNNNEAEPRVDDNEQDNGLETREYYDRSPDLFSPVSSEEEDFSLTQILSQNVLTQQAPEDRFDVYESNRLSINEAMKASTRSKIPLTPYVRPSLTPSLRRSSSRTPPSQERRQASILSYFDTSQIDQDISIDDTELNINSSQSDYIEPSQRSNPNLLDRPPTPYFGSPMDTSPVDSSPVLRTMHSRSSNRIRVNKLVQTEPVPGLAGLPEWDRDDDEIPITQNRQDIEFFREYEPSTYDKDTQTETEMESFATFDDVTEVGEPYMSDTRPDVINLTTQIRELCNNNQTIVIDKTAFHIGDDLYTIRIKESCSQYIIRLVKLEKERSATLVDLDINDANKDEDIVKTIDEQRLDISALLNLDKGKVNKNNEPGPKDLHPKVSNSLKTEKQDIKKQTELDKPKNQVNSTNTNTNRIVQVANKEPPIVYTDAQLELISLNRAKAMILRRRRLRRIRKARFKNIRLYTKVTSRIPPAPTFTSSPPDSEMGKETQVYWLNARYENFMQFFPPPEKYKKMLIQELLTTKWISKEIVTKNFINIVGTIVGIYTNVTEKVHLTVEDTTGRITCVVEQQHFIQRTRVKERLDKIENFRKTPQNGAPYSKSELIDLVKKPDNEIVQKGLHDEAFTKKLGQAVSYILLQKSNKETADYPRKCDLNLGREAFGQYVSVTGKVFDWSEQRVIYAWNVKFITQEEFYGAYQKLIK